MSLIPDEHESQQMLRGWSRMYHKRQKSKKVPAGFQIIEDVNIFDKNGPTVLMHEDKEYRPHRPRKQK